MGARGLVIRDGASVAGLRRLGQAEADRCAALRALATAQGLEEASRAEAARLAGRERRLPRDAAVRFNAGGSAGLRNRPRPGRSGKPGLARREEPRAWVLAGPAPGADGLGSHRRVGAAGHVEQR